MAQQDEFEQYKRSAGGAGDEFAQFKRPRDRRAAGGSWPAPPPPGFFQRTAEAVGIPTSLQQVKDLTKTTPAQMGEALGEQFKGAVKRGAKEVGEAARNIYEGGPVGANVGKAGYGVLTGALESNPITQPVETLSEDIKARNYPAAAGDLVGSTVNYFLLKGAKKPGTKPRIEKLTSATGPAGGETTAALRTTLPELDKTVAVAGKPQTIGEFEKVVKATQNRLTQQFNGALYRNAHRQVVPTEISDALKARAAEMPPTAEGQALARELQKEAIEYERPWTLRDLNRQREFKNAQMRGFYGKEASGQMAAVRSNAQVMADKIISDGTRDLLYDELGKYDKGANWKQLKNQQHHLINLQDQLAKRVGDLADKQAAMAGESFFEKESVSASLHGGGVSARAHGLQRLLPGMGPETAASAKVRAAFPSARSMAARKAVLALPISKLGRQPNVPPPPKQAQDQ